MHVPDHQRTSRDVVATDTIPTSIPAPEITCGADALGTGQRWGLTI